MHWQTLITAYTELYFLCQKRRGNLITYLSEFYVLSLVQWPTVEECCSATTDKGIKLGTQSDRLVTILDQNNRLATFSNIFLEQDIDWWIWLCQQLSNCVCSYLYLGPEIIFYGIYHHARFERYHQKEPAFSEQCPVLQVKLNSLLFQIYCLVNCAYILGQQEEHIAPKLNNKSKH